MRITPVLLVLWASFALSGPASANQTVWKWVDANGVTHYSDRPVPGATKMELNLGKSSSAANTPAASSSSSSVSTTSANAGPVYRNFEIWKPGSDENITNTGGVVPVEVRIDPVLQPGHSLFLYLDGRLVEGYPDNTTSFELKEVARGMHTLRAIINAGSGTRVQETAQVVFNVLQASVAQPPVGPTLRPPPKPKPNPQRGASNKLPNKQPTYGELHDTRTAAIDPATNRPVNYKPTTQPATPTTTPKTTPKTTPATAPKTTPLPTKRAQ